MVLVSVVAAACATTTAPERAGSLGELTYVTFSSLHRLTPAVDVERPEAHRRIDLEAARGEREAGQLVVWSRGGTERVQLSATDLEGADGQRIDASAVRVYVEQPMRVERGSRGGRRGEYVDPLVPAAGLRIDLHADVRLLAWVDVAAPVDAAPGSYRGHVLVRRSAGDAVLARVPIDLRVRAVRMLDRPLLGSFVGVDASQLERFEQVAAGSDELHRTFEQYAALLGDARMSIGDLGYPAPGTRAFPVDAGGQASVRRMLTRRGVASVRVPFYMNSPYADPLGRDRRAAMAYLREAAAWLRRNDLLDRAFVYAIDEPDDAEAGEVRELHELVHAADPDLQLLVTREASARGLAGSVDIWVPNISPDRFDPADVARERRRGHVTWWYPSFTTVAPYPSLVIDELRPAPRALGWLAWRYDIRGLLYWSATHWHEVADPYRDTATYRESSVVANGDGVLVYPGGPIGRPGRPNPSTRLLQLRDGMEDHELIARASCVMGRAARRQLAQLVRDLAPSMVQIMPTDEQVRSVRGVALDALERRDSRRGCRAA